MAGPAFGNIPSLYSALLRAGFTWLPAEQALLLRGTRSALAQNKFRFGAEQAPLLRGANSAISVAGGTVGSYPAFPSLRELYNPRGLFLLHFPWSRLRRPLTGALALWSPNFPRVLL